MHAWESIQKTLDWIEVNIKEDIQIEMLADMAALSLFYYQRLFSRLVKRPVREYIKLRRLALACESLRNTDARIVDIAIEHGFGSREAFSRAFKGTYGIWPSQYRDDPIGLDNFDKPDLLLGYVMIDEGVPLISDGLVLEMNRKTLATPIDFAGISTPVPFKRGKMLGERPGISGPDAVWRQLFKRLHDAPHLRGGRMLGVFYDGDAPAGHADYFAGTEVMDGMCSSGFDTWQMPSREYVVCSFEAENFEQLGPPMGKAMKYTRFWLKKHGLIADGFFVELYHKVTPHVAHIELWIPFRNRENKEEATNEQV